MRSRRLHPAVWAVPALAFSCAACAIAQAQSQTPASQSALFPAGIQAQRIYSLWHISFWLLVGVYVIVMAFVVIPLFRRRRRAAGSAGLEADLPNLHPDPLGERRLTIAVGSGVSITIIILFILLIGDFVTGNRIRSLSSASDPLTIKLVGHQWWWEVTYKNASPDQIVTDANEIHLPVGRPVRIDLESHDVIHSFWAPNFSGKKDLVPGHPTSIWIRADQAGTFWGQCAEFCGFQHAHMRFAVVAESQARFQQWLESAREPAKPPQTDLQKRGQLVFMAHTCSMCHTIGGTSAAGRVGPNLTHIASRKTIAAGSLPNSMGHLGGWIVDPQGIKPGVIMPQHQLKPEDLQALLEYLEGLK